MIITELFYNDPVTGKSVSEKKVEQVEPNDTINDISEHSHLTAKQIMSHLEGYFDCIFITSPKITIAELSHFIPRTTDELCEFMKLYIPGDDILFHIDREKTVKEYCENDVKATEDSFSQYMNPPVSDKSVTMDPKK